MAENTDPPRRRPQLVKQRTHENPAEAVLEADAAVPDLSAARAAKEAKAEQIEAEKPREEPASVIDLRTPKVKPKLVRAPFSSYMEVGLLARVVDHCERTGESKVDLLSRAMRLALGDDIEEK